MSSTFISSPFNYVNSKYKLLNKIIPLFPEHISTFIDLFGGSFSIGVNVNCDMVIYNDNCYQISQMLQFFKDKQTDTLIEYINKIISDYHLSYEDDAGYYKLKDAYNCGYEKTPMALYALACYSFNHQIRFNDNQEFNIPYGIKGLFDSQLKSKFIKFCDKLHNINCGFYNKDFNVLMDKRTIDSLVPDCFVYCDPPYFNTFGAYVGKCLWSGKNERQLLELLDALNDKKIKWALSNNLEINRNLQEWFDGKYKVRCIDNNEVVITNY